MDLFILRKSLKPELHLYSNLSTSSNNKSRINLFILYFFSVSTKAGPYPKPHWAMIRAPSYWLPTNKVIIATAPPLQYILYHLYFQFILISTKCCVGLLLHINWGNVDKSKGLRLSWLYNCRQTRSFATIRHYRHHSGHN